MTIIQLYNCDGGPAGLYMTSRKDIYNFQEEFDAAFSNLDVDNVQEEADDWLSEHKDIHRVFAEEVYTDSI